MNGNGNSKCTKCFALFLRTAETYNKDSTTWPWPHWWLLGISYNVNFTACRERITIDVIVDDRGGGWGRGGGSNTRIVTSEVKPTAPRQIQPQCIHTSARVRVCFLGVNYTYCDLRWNRLFCRMGAGGTSTTTYCEICAKMNRNAYTYGGGFKYRTQTNVSQPTLPWTMGEGDGERGGGGDPIHVLCLLR